MQSPTGGTYLGAKRLCLDRRPRGYKREVTHGAKSVLKSDMRVVDQNNWTREVVGEMPRRIGSARLLEREAEYIAEIHPMLNIIHRVDRSEN